ncbi:MAG: hypothetical protein KGL95_09790, partial [Patescibacteria group bacterium]|nr:hypothetical protein [Patescibacteria group bacterium]
MKEKLLLYVDFQFIHLSLAQILQKKIDCDCFAIVDLNDKPRQFFDKQEIVKFKKTWYYRDHVVKSDKKPDLEYLKSIEDRYKINLWKIAYAERAFYQFNKYYKFTRDEILSILEQECRLFEKIINEVEPDYLLINTSDWHHMHLLCELCRAKCIKVLMLVPTRFGSRMMVSNDLDRMDQAIDYTNIEDKKRTIEQLLEYRRKYDLFKKVMIVKEKTYTYNSKTIKAALQFFLTSGNENYRKNYTNYGKTRLRALFIEGITLLKKKFREQYMNRNFLKESDYKLPFVYFPLHLEPERVLLIGAPYYTNQIEVIKNIAKSLPIGLELYVKEHPVMSVDGWRQTSYYKSIMELPNVSLIHPEVKPDDIIKNCKLVISIAGTTGLEAAFYGKPAVIFSEFWGSHLLSTVHKLEKIDNISEAIKKSIEKKVDPKELEFYVGLLERNSFEFDHT